MWLTAGLLPGLLTTSVAAPCAFHMDGVWLTNLVTKAPCAFLQGCSLDYSSSHFTMYLTSRVLRGSVIQSVRTSYASLHGCCMGYLPSRLCLTACLAWKLPLRLQWWTRGFCQPCSTLQNLLLIMRDILCVVPRAGGLANPSKGWCCWHCNKD
jgi:hypothetical protein